ncbi:MAG: methyltransferase [Ferruginibacter sp.]
MANNYFQFKQFTIYQDQCAMKVCTDACIFGAFVAGQINKKQLMAESIIDIGTGTGLLSLMVAQKTTGIIDAIEMDEAAFEQAKHNFEESPWRERLNIFNSDARLFYPRKKYHCIISNPPFFEGDLKSANYKKNTSKHDTTLTLEQLLYVINRLLAPNGTFALLLPYHRVDSFIATALSSPYFLNELLLIQHTKEHPFFRGILFFSREETTVAGNELAIKNEDGSYTIEFIRLMEDYYL